MQGNNETKKNLFLSKKRKYSFPLQRLTFTEEMDSKQTMTYVIYYQKMVNNIKSGNSKL